MLSHEYGSRGRGFLGRSEPRWKLRAYDLEEKSFEAFYQTLNGTKRLRDDLLFRRVDVMYCVTQERVAPIETLALCVFGLFIPVIPLLWGAKNGVFSWNQAITIMFDVLCLMIVITPIVVIYSHRKARLRTKAFTNSIEYGAELEKIAREAVQQSRASLIKEVGRFGARASLPYMWQAQERARKLRTQ